MPKELLLEKWNNLDCPSPQEKREQLKDFFKVSREEMQRRLSDLESVAFLDSTFFFSDPFFDCIISLNI